jgi:phosphoribosyl 1,2-cyclic phosphate phosphodiesterase
VLLTLPAGRILIDTPPELRLQLLRAQVPLIHAVLLTHYHADHLFGLDDVRVFPKYLGGPLPLHCTAEVEEVVRRAFSYAFAPGADSQPVGYLPKLEFRRFESGKAFEVLGQRIQPVRLEHYRFEVHGFRVEDVAYCTDVSRIPAESWPQLEGLQVLILDALRPKPHPAHFSLDEALAVIEKLKPQRAYLTHLSHELEHEATERKLPPNVRIAYDGLSFTF